MKLNGQIVNLKSEVSLLDFLQQSNYDISKIAVDTEYTNFCVNETTKSVFMYY